MIGNEWYQYLTQEQSDQIEAAYKQYKETLETSQTYIECESDLYEVKFCKSMLGQWTILNTETQFSRRLVRQNVIRGPFRETKTINWTIVTEDGHALEGVIPEEAQSLMTDSLLSAKNQRNNVAKYVQIQQPNDHIYCAEYDKKACTSFLLNLKDLKKIHLQQKEVIRRWDYLTTFRPPEHLSIESGQIYEKIQIQPGSPEYDFASQLFISTFNGRIA